jgi:hypothetical protein
MIGHVQAHFLIPEHGNLLGKSEGVPVLDKPESVLLANVAHGIQWRDAGRS